MSYQEFSIHNFSFILKTVLGVDSILMSDTGNGGSELSGLTEGHVGFAATGHRCPAPFHHA